MGEKSKGGRRNMKTQLCIPTLRGNKCTPNNKSLSPMSLLERFREAFFRLLMLSALTKATHNTAGSVSVDVQRPYYPSDAHQSEAVADCIEFIKKSASNDDDTHDSTASSSIDATAEVVVPVPVM